MSPVNLLQIMASVSSEPDLAESLDHILDRTIAESYKGTPEINAVVDAFNVEIAHLKEDSHLQTANSLGKVLGLILVPLNQGTLYRSWLAAHALI